PRYDSDFVNAHNVTLDVVIWSSRHLGHVLIWSFGWLGPGEFTEWEHDRPDTECCEQSGHGRRHQTRFGPAGQRAVDQDDAHARGHRRQRGRIGRALDVEPSDNWNKEPHAQERVEDLQRLDDVLR